MVLRLAVFASPRPGTEWHRLSSAWLGRDAVTGRTVRRTNELPVEELHDLTATAATYGFHATLRSPFRLADDIEVADVLAGVERAAASLAAVAPRLVIGRIGGFAAFVPDGGGDELAALERAVVNELDHCVRPLDYAELQRRRQAGLSERHYALLVRWGYPYVLDQFR